MQRLKVENMNKAIIIGRSIAIPTKAFVNLINIGIFEFVVFLAWNFLDYYYATYCCNLFLLLEFL